MQTPTLGRIVLVKGDRVMSNGSRVHPAIVTRVFSPDVINVMVMPDARTPEPQTSVHLVADEVAADDWLATHPHQLAAFWPRLV